VNDTYTHKKGIEMGQVYTVRTASIKAKQMNDSGQFIKERMEVRIASYICDSHEKDAYVSCIERGYSHYENKKPAEYIILDKKNPTTPTKDWFGSKVYQYTGNGVFEDDKELKNFKVVGVIMGEPRKWYVEVRPQMIKDIHLTREFA